MPSEPERRIVTSLTLEEVSHVDDPANPGARVVLWKRKSGGHDVTPEELVKKLEDAEARVAELEKASEKATALEKRLDDVLSALPSLDVEVRKSEDGEIVLEKRRDDPDYIDFEGERILKSSLPEPVLKSIERQRDELRKMNERLEYDELKKRARERFPNLGATVEQKAALLKTAESVADEKEREALLKTLREADSAVAQLFKASGSEHQDDHSPEQRLNKMARDYASEKGVSFSKAYSAVLETPEGRELAESRRAVN